MSDHGYPPLALQSCANCRYSLPRQRPLETNDEWLRCARHSPTLLWRSPSLGFWPNVLPDDWCGEWGPGEDPFVLGGDA